MFVKKDALATSVCGDDVLISFDSLDNISLNVPLFLSILPFLADDLDGRGLSVVHYGHVWRAVDRATRVWTRKGIRETTR